MSCSELFPVSRIGLFHMQPGSNGIPEMDYPLGTIGSLPGAPQALSSRELPSVLRLVDVDLCSFTVSSILDEAVCVIGTG